MLAATTQTVRHPSARGFAGWCRRWRDSTGRVAAIVPRSGSGWPKTRGWPGGPEILTSIPGVSRVTAGGPADPDAGTRPPRRQGGRQPGRPRARDSAIRRLVGPQLHPGRPGAGAAAALYAGIGGDPLQPGPAREVSSARRGGKAAEGRGGRRHAHAPRAGHRTARPGPLLAS